MPRAKQPAQPSSNGSSDPLPKWPLIKPKKGLVVESVMDDQIYVIDVSWQVNNVQYPIRVEVVRLGVDWDLADDTSWLCRTCSVRRNVELLSSLGGR